MAKFLTPLRVEDMDGSRWVLCSPLSYQSEIADGIITAEKDFATDFASIPGFAQGLISKNGLWDFGAVIHDLLYSQNGRVEVMGEYSLCRRVLTRRQCDQILREAMICKGVGIIRRTLIYNSVRHFGWAAWNNHKKQNEN